MMQVNTISLGRGLRHSVASGRNASRCLSIGVGASEWAQKSGAGSNNATAAQSAYPENSNLARTHATLVKLRNQLARLRQLGAGWDGHDAVPLEPSILARAGVCLEFALAGKEHVPAPHIAPIADGGVQAEWYIDRHRLEVYFEHDGSIAAWSENLTTHVEMEAEGTDAIQLLADWVSSLEQDHLAA